MATRPLRALVVFAIVMLSSSTARAQRTDVVTLANGDRITGEILELSRGRLEFKTDDAGTIDIEWDKILKLEGVRSFEVVTSTGLRLLGSLAPTVDRSLLIVGSAGDESLELSAVTSIVPIGASFWKKLDGAVDAGFNYTRSSGIAQSTMNAYSLYRRPAFEMKLSGSATLTQSDDEEDENDDRASTTFSYLRYFGLRSFVIGGGQLESNESLGLALRSQIGLSVGINLVSTNRSQFAISGGLVGNNEQGVDTEATQNIEGIFSVRSSFYTYDRPKTTFDGSIQYYPSLSNWGRRRLQLDSSARRELWKDFYVSLNVFDSYDSDPPNVDAAHNDVGVTASVGWSY